MERSLVIKVHNDTLTKLKNANFALYCFQGVVFGPPPPKTKTTAAFGGGGPLVWLRSIDYLNTTEIKWQDDLWAYIAHPAEKGPVSVGSKVKTALGQIVSANDSGVLKAKTGGRADVVSILNEGKQEWESGLAISATGASSSTPLSTFPLYGQQQIMIAPANSMLVMFAADTWPVGTKVTNAWNAGMLVHFGNQSKRTLNYDINSGWDAKDATWATPVAANEDLGNLLIIPSNKAS